MKQIVSSTCILLILLLLRNISLSIAKKKILQNQSPQHECKETDEHCLYLGNNVDLKTKKKTQKKKKRVNEDNYGTQKQAANKDKRDRKSNTKERFMNSEDIVEEGGQQDPDIISNVENIMDAIDPYIYANNNILSTVRTLPYPNAFTNKIDMALGVGYMALTKSDFLLSHKIFEVVLNGKVASKATKYNALHGMSLAYTMQGHYAEGLYYIELLLNEQPDYFDGYKLKLQIQGHLKPPFQSIQETITALFEIRNILKEHVVRNIYEVVLFVFGQKHYQTSTDILYVLIHEISERYSDELENSENEDTLTEEIRDILMNSYIYLSKSLEATSDFSEAVTALQNAFTVADGSNAQLLLQDYKRLVKLQFDAGDINGSLALLSELEQGIFHQNIISTDNEYRSIYLDLCLIAANIYQALGDAVLSISYSQKISQHNNMAVYGNFVAIHNYANIGDYKSAIDICDKMIKYYSPKAGKEKDYNLHNLFWYRRELLYALSTTFDISFAQFNIDMLLDKRVKAGSLEIVATSDPLPLQAYNGIYEENYLQKKSSKNFLLDGSFSNDQDWMSNAKSIISYSSGLTQFMQLNYSSFPSNSRKHKIFGIAILSTAQLLYRHIQCVSEGYDGLFVSNLASSSTRTMNVNLHVFQTWSDITSKVSLSPHCNVISKVDASRFHLFQWRDIFDESVRYRKYAEWSELTYWYDSLPESFLKNNIGFSTGILQGEQKIAKYFPYFDKFLNTFKKTVVSEGFRTDNDINSQVVHFPKEHVKELMASHTIDEVYDVITKYAKVSSNSLTYVLLNVSSSAYEDVYMTGTRISLEPYEPVGFSFRMASLTNKRKFAVYEKELESIFQRLVKELGLHFQSQSKLKSGSGDSKKHKKNLIKSMASDKHSQRVIKIGLELFYYWMQLSPLTRGTSSCGYMILLSILLIVKKKVTFNPRQLDLDALLHSNFEDFVFETLSWLQIEEETRSPSMLEESVVSIFSTPQKLLYAINEINDM